MASPFDRLNLDKNLACEFLAVFARYGADLQQLELRSVLRGKQPPLPPRTTGEAKSPLICIIGTLAPTPHATIAHFGDSYPTSSLAGECVGFGQQSSDNRYSSLGWERRRLVVS